MNHYKYKLLSTLSARVNGESVWWGVAVIRLVTKKDTVINLLQYVI